VAVWTTLALAAALAVGCATVPVTGRQQLSLVPQVDLVQASAEGYRELIAASRLSTDSAATARVSRVGGRVASAAEAFLRDHEMGASIRYYDWEFALIDDDETINAFCMSGGKIAVYSGILPAAEDETGLAVVVAHEVAHAIANHGGERMSQLLLAELGGMALARAMQEKPEETQDLVFLAYGIGAQVGVLLPYSRQHELEADRIGLILMARAGYDPRQAVPFWQRMAAAGGARPPEFLSTHPAPESRIDSIREHLPEAVGQYQP
jgi:predicted Zn-dependent protease